MPLNEQVVVLVIDVAGRLAVGSVTPFHAPDIVKPEFIKPGHVEDVEIIAVPPGHMLAPVVTGGAGLTVTVAEPVAEQVVAVTVADTVYVVVEDGLTDTDCAEPKELLHA